MDPSVATVEPPKKIRKPICSKKREIYPFMGAKGLQFWSPAVSRWVTLLSSSECSSFYSRFIGFNYIPEDYLNARWEVRRSGWTYVES